MDLSVVAAAREDDSPFEETLDVAIVADRLGFGEVWVGEGPTWDAFTLTTAVGLKTTHVAITAGPVPVSVRDPASIVRGAASSEFLIGRPVGIALGASSNRVVEGFHGRSRSRVADVLEASAEEIRARMTSHQNRPGGGFRRILPPPGGPLTVAAFGRRAIAVAARFADRMVLDLVTPDQVAALRSKLIDASAAAGRRPPVLAAWLPAAVDPLPESEHQILASIVGYLAVPGYADMFIAAGFSDAVEQARAGGEPGRLLDLLPANAASNVGLVGDIEAIRARLEEYAAAGLDEVAIVPAASGDPSGERTLSALASL